MISGSSHCVLRIHLLSLNHMQDRSLVIPIIQHHLVRLKDHGAGLPHFPQRPLIQLLKLVSGLFLCLPETIDFPFRLFDGPSSNLLFFFFINCYFPHSNGCECTFSSDYFHKVLPSGRRCCTSFSRIALSLSLLSIVILPFSFPIYFDYF